VLDGRDTGTAAEAPVVLPAPGRHTLVLLSAEGRMLDRSVFSIR